LKVAMTTLNLGESTALTISKERFPQPEDGHRAGRARPVLHDYRVNQAC